MKKIKEKDICILRGLCVVIALAVGTLSVLYLIGILQNGWCLDVILGLGVLLHAALAVLLFVEHRNVISGIALVLAVIDLILLIVL
jgi:hypothetical protein